MFKLSPECRHVMPGGRKCRALALKGEHYCYYHARTRHLAEVNHARKHSVVLPPIEDHASLLMALNALYAGHAASKINRRTLGTYVYGLNLADKIISRGQNFPASDSVQPGNGSGDTPATAPQEADSPACCDSPAPPAQHALPENQTPSMPEETGDDDAEQCLTGIDAEHEFEPESPLPLTKKDLHQKRRHAEADIRNLRSARTFWAAKVAANDQKDGPPEIPLAHIERQIEKSEKELKELIAQQTPDPAPDDPSQSDP